MAEATCSVDDCARVVRARGLCNMHYDRWRKTGATGSAAPSRRGSAEAPLAACSVDGCGRTSQTRGWCGMHYARWRANGTVELVPRARPVCVTDGCEKEGTRRGRCYLHYQRWRRMGDSAVATCSVEGCSAAVVGRGWCGRHWQRWRKYGEPGAAESLRVVPLTGRRCSCCGEEKGPDEFYLRAGRRPGGERVPMSRCRACMSNNSQRWQAANKARMREVNSAYAKRNSKKRRLKQYGLTEAEFLAMEEAQGGACRVCGDVVGDALVIDHCHRTGRVRGLLCALCNTALGGFRDDPELMISAIRYLAETEDDASDMRDTAG